MRTHPFFYSVFILVMGLVSCSKSTTDTTVEIDPVLLIPPIDQLYSGALTEFQQSTASLMAATLSWTDAGEQGTENARMAWLDAMERWQAIDTFRFGLYNVLSYQRDDGFEFIYTWPVMSPCAVDRATLAKGYQADDFFETAPNTFGLAAMEYLLYGPMSTACPDPEDQELPDTLAQAYADWQNLTPEEITTRRAEYAHVLATQIHQSSLALESVWSSYIETVLAREYIPEPTAHTEPLTVIVNYLFALNTRVAYSKLAVPLGLSWSCEDEDCWQKVESNISKQGGRWLAINLEVTRTIFTGGNYVGLDDLLTRNNKSELRDNIIETFQRAIDIAQSLEADLESEILNNRSVVERLHHAVEDLIGLFYELRRVWDIYMFQSLPHED